MEKKVSYNLLIDFVKEFKYNYFWSILLPIISTVKFIFHFMLKNMGV